MKTKLLFTGLFLAFLCFSANAQELSPAIKTNVLYKTTPTIEFATPDMDAIHAQDEVNDKNGMLYRIGVHAFTDITTSNNGTWTSDAAGNKIWQLNFRFPGAEALSFLFQTFKIYGGTTVDVFGKTARDYIKQ